jgi:all-trans-8'-apo-beta-carotenal 15,15'-oxygenase
MRPPMTITMPQITRRAWMEKVSAMSLMALAGRPSRATTLNNVWKRNYAPYEAPAFGGDIKAHDLSFTGRPPAELQGYFYRNGPARFARGTSRLSHWFDGDGMVQRFSIQGSRVSHYGRMLNTPKSEQEQQHQRFLYSGFGSEISHALSINRPDDFNPSNINLLSMEGGKKLYALWEAGSALEIDPLTLQSLGQKTWSAETRNAPFSAHPKVDSDGTVWNYGHLSGSGKLLIYHIGATGHLLRQHVLDLPQTDMVHDFAITDQYLIFLLQPLVAERLTLDHPNILSSLRWHHDAPMLLCLIHKDDFRTNLIELPNSGVFHLSNAWQHGHNLRLGYVHHDNILNTLHSFDIEKGTSPTVSVGTQWREVVVDMRRMRAEVIATDIHGVEFPRIHERFIGKAHRLTVMLQRSAPLPAQAGVGFDQVLVLNGMKAQRYAYGDGWLAEEHIVVPHPHRAEENAGWILGTAYHWPSETTTLSVFSTTALADGPLAQWKLPYGLPLGLHGQFVPA